MKNHLTILFLLLACFASKAQTDSSKESLENKNSQTLLTEKVFTKVETMPEYPGGEDALFKFIAKNVKYPTEAREHNITGKVYATFIIDAAGSINDVKIMRGIGGGCDEEVIRVINLMPKWKPGMQNGEPVNVQYTIPVNFNIDPEKK